MGTDDKKGDRDYCKTIYLDCLHKITAALTDEWLSPGEIAAKTPGLTLNRVRCYLPIIHRNGWAQYKCVPDKRNGIHQLHSFYRKVQVIGGVLST